MRKSPPEEIREFTGADGARWEARVVAHGGASPYLAPKVHRPTVQFTCLDAPPRPRRYAALAAPRLDALDETALVRLLGRARAH